MMMKQYCNAFWLFLFIHLSNNNIAFIHAQSSSCNNAQILPSGNPFVAEALKNWTEVDISRFTSNVPASDLPPGGHWFTYRTSLNETSMTWFSLTPILTDDTSEGIHTPDFAIFKGSCASLMLEGVELFGDLFPFENEVGIDYFIYVYQSLEYYAPYTLTIEELQPPANDKIENAFALTAQDLPFRGDFTTMGSRSDFSVDGCALYDDKGVWFSYTTSFDMESVALQLGGFVTMQHSPNIVGVQVANGDQFTCVAMGDQFSTIEWTAERGVQYLILITWPRHYDSYYFEFKLQSRGGIMVSPSPTGRSVDPPVASPVAAPAVPTVSPTESAGETVPTISATESPIQGSSGSGAIFSSALVFSGLIVFVV